MLVATRKVFSAVRTHSRSAHIPARNVHLTFPTAFPPIVPARRSLSTSFPAMFALTPFRGAPGSAPPKTFSRQGELPRLPVPTLEETFPRYLKSLEPVLRQKEELGQLPSGATAASELQKRAEWAQEAVKEGSLARKLQQRLIDVDRTTPDNWLDDRYWLQKAYHEWRVPLLVNSNWWLMFRADPNTPAADLELGKVQPERYGALTPSEDFSVALGAKEWKGQQWGIRRATWITGRLLEFKRRLDHQEIMPDASRSSAFCMHQYTRLFGVSRIPAIPHDWNTATPHPTVARHVCVMARNNFYQVEVLGQDGVTRPLEEIEKAFTDIVEDAKKADGDAVGILTADDRDTWARAREHLLAISKVNRATLGALEDCLFVVSLDSSVLPNVSGHPEPVTTATPASVDAHARNIAGAGRGGHNRWFDKALSVVMEPNGRGGINGEHSPCDALIPSIVIDFALAEPAPEPGQPFPNSIAPAGPAGATASWKKLQWELDDKAHASIASSAAAARQLVSTSDIGMLWYDEYGAEWIKKVAKQSPDAFLQMALQLAYANVKGYQSPTYETASTRVFKHGRTDVIRSFSNEAYEFVRAVREKKPASEIYRLLSAACQSHNAQTRAASTGKGFDRHLTGLRLAYNPEEDGTPEEACEAGARILLGDELLGESQTWKLSTSGLSSGLRFCGTGFGSGFEDGVGTNYLAGGQLLKFGLETKHSPMNSKDPTATFSKALVDALRLMKEMCEKEAPAATEGETKGKL
ncbi:acyltransferase ChoActase/COT/CPT [Ceraceosorus guamensis]|uniref:Acyltransferase ChoActase/COT/CPT n=1 Tax=Ceraceosorus guamensis TaxID=1522189 RepID=A0A316VX10_9BASI|nr:acyltransferase ChoActase/COT/CPT [Ceraceosorus guamensis]PWN41844.1 acyltransferase ChoActase/COT/CPT [Ceraceosorus guamensis]